MSRLFSISIPACLFLLGQASPSGAPRSIDWKTASREEVARAFKSKGGADRAWASSLSGPIRECERRLRSLEEDFARRRYPERALETEHRKGLENLYRVFPGPDAARMVRDLGGATGARREAFAEMALDPVFRAARPLITEGGELLDRYRSTLRMVEFLGDGRILFSDAEVSELFRRMPLLLEAAQCAEADGLELSRIPPEGRPRREAVERLLATLEDPVRSRGLKEASAILAPVEAELRSLSGRLRLEAFLQSRREELGSLQGRLSEAEKRRLEALKYLPPRPGQEEAAPAPGPAVAAMREHERWKAAREILLECLVLDPTSLWGLYDYGRVSDFRRSVGDAVSAWTRFLALHDPLGRKEDPFTRGLRDYIAQNRQLGR